MPYSLQFPTFTAYDYTISMCDRNDTLSKNPVFAWLSYGRLGETVTVAPRYTTVTVEPSAKDRYLTDVIVEPIAPSVYSVELAVDAVMTISANGIGSVTTSAPEVATAALADGVVTVTGVAAGTTVVKVFDNANDLMYTVNVTVA